MQALREAPLHGRLQRVIVLRAERTILRRGGRASELRVQRLACDARSQDLARIQIELAELADYQRAHVTRLRHEPPGEFFLDSEIAGLHISAVEVLRDRVDHNGGRHREDAIAVIRRHSRWNSLRPISYRRVSIRALIVRRNHERIVGAHSAWAYIVRITRDAETG